MEARVFTIAPSATMAEGLTTAPGSTATPMPSSAAVDTIANRLTALTPARPAARQRAVMSSREDL